MKLFTSAMDLTTGYDDFDPRDTPEPEDEDAIIILDEESEEDPSDTPCDCCGSRRDDLRTVRTRTPFGYRERFLCPDCEYDGEE